MSGCIKRQRSGGTVQSFECGAASRLYWCLKADSDLFQQKAADILCNYLLAIR